MNDEKGTKECAVDTDISGRDDEEEEDEEEDDDDDEEKEDIEEEKTMEESVASCVERKEDVITVQ